MIDTLAGFFRAVTRGLNAMTDENMDRVRRLAITHSATVDQIASAQADWPRKAAEMIPYVKELVHPLQKEYGVLVYWAPDGLTLEMESRIADVSNRVKLEKGARCRFGVNDSGHVVAHTLPAENHGLHSAGWKSFTGLGPVAEATENKLGGAVCEWLEWAVGAGRSRFVAPLQSSPPPPSSLPPLPPLPSAD